MIFVEVLPTRPPVYRFGCECGWTKEIEENSMSNVFKDAREFTDLYNEKTGNSSKGKIDVPFIKKMISDEVQELEEAKDETEQVDALLDATYYIVQHLASTGLKMEPIWDLIHKANMTKFGEGGYKRDDGKWMKPPDFVAPDDDIRKEIEIQRNESKN